MTTKPKRRPVTYDDLRRVPDHYVAEILGGELFVTPRPAPPHAVAATAIGANLHGAFNGPPGSAWGPGGWWIMFEPELHLRADVVVPDVAGWRQASLPTIPNLVGHRVPPDWVAEVISPSTAKIDRGRKLAIYAREGVGHLWIVDPLARTLETYRLEDGGRWVVLGVHEGDATIRAEPFEEVELAMARWWMGVETTAAAEG